MVQHAALAATLLNCQRYISISSFGTICIVTPTTTQRSMVFVSHRADSVCAHGAQVLAHIRLHPSGVNRTGRDSHAQYKALPGECWRVLLSVVEYVVARSYHAWYNMLRLLLRY